MKANTDHPIVILSKALPAKVVGLLILQIAGVVGVLVFGSVILGMFIDRSLGTRPLFTLALALISLPLAVALTYKLALRASNNARKHYEEYIESKRESEANGRPAAGQPLKVDG